MHTGTVFMGRHDHWSEEEQFKMVGHEEEKTMGGFGGQDIW